MEGPNGVFLDGTGWIPQQDCRLKKCGEDKTSCCVFSAESEEAFNQGILEAVKSMKDQIHEDEEWLEHLIHSVSIVSIFIFIHVRGL